MGTVFHADRQRRDVPDLLPIAIRLDGGVAQNGAQSGVRDWLSCLYPRRPIAETPFLAARLFYF
jgi:hypothetical protein